jgi:Ca-activated chloride channel family protein
MNKKLRLTLLILYGLAALGIMAAAFIFPKFRGLAYAPLREAFTPEADPIPLSVYYSTEKEAWLENTLIEFQKADLRVDGKPIEIELTPFGSREMYLSVLDGAQPDVISPASSLQTAILEDLSKSKFGQPLVDASDPQSCQSVVETPLVLVAWAERADVLWDGEPNSHTWRRIHDALLDPQGWASYGHPEWGYVKFGQTNPLTSNSGFMTILLLTYEYHQKTGNLTADDILSSPEFQEWFLGFQGTISQFGNSTGTYMEEIIAYGPSMYDIVAVYESTAIENFETAAGHYGDLRVYYPPAIVMSDHPFCILNGDWVTPEKTTAAQIWIDFLLSTDAQQAALMEHGYRPVDPQISIDQPGSPFQRYQANGIQLQIPTEVELPPGNVLDTLLTFWSRNIQK